MIQGYFEKDASGPGIYDYLLHANLEVSFIPNLGFWHKLVFNIT